MQWPLAGANYLSKVHYAVATGGANYLSKVHYAVATGGAN